MAPRHGLRSQPECPTHPSGLSRASLYRRRDPPSQGQSQHSVAWTPACSTSQLAPASSARDSRIGRGANAVGGARYSCLVASVYQSARAFAGFGVTWRRHARRINRVARSLCSPRNLLKCKPTPPQARTLLSRGSQVRVLSGALQNPEQINENGLETRCNLLRPVCVDGAEKDSPTPDPGLLTDLGNSDGSPTSWI